MEFQVAASSVRNSLFDGSWEQSPDLDLCISEAATHRSAGIEQLLTGKSTLAYYRM